MGNHSSNNWRTIHGRGGTLLSAADAGSQKGKAKELEFKQQQCKSKPRHGVKTRHQHEHFFDYYELEKKSQKVKLQRRNQCRSNPLAANMQLSEKMDRGAASDIFAGSLSNPRARPNGDNCKSAGTRNENDCVIVHNEPTGINKCKLESETTRSLNKFEKCLNVNNASKLKRRKNTKKKKRMPVGGHGPSATMNDASSSTITNNTPFATSRRRFCILNKSDTNSLRSQIKIWFPYVCHKPTLKALQDSFIRMKCSVFKELRKLEIIDFNKHITQSKEQRHLFRKEHLHERSSKCKPIYYKSGIVPECQKGVCSLNFDNNGCPLTSGNDTEEKYDKEQKPINYKTKATKNLEGYPFTANERRWGHSLMYVDCDKLQMATQCEVPANVKELEMLKPFAEEETKPINIPEWFQTMLRKEVIINIRPSEQIGPSSELKQLMSCQRRLQLGHMFHSSDFSSGDGCLLVSVREQEVKSHGDIDEQLPTKMQTTSSRPHVQQREVEFEPDSHEDLHRLEIAMPLDYKYLNYASKCSQASNGSLAESFRRRLRRRNRVSKISNYKSHGYKRLSMNTENTQEHSLSNSAEDTQLKLGNCVLRERSGDKKQNQKGAYQNQSSLFHEETSKIILSASDSICSPICQELSGETLSKTATNILSETKLVDRITAERLQNRKYLPLEKVIPEVNISGRQKLDISFKGEQVKNAGTETNRKTQKETLSGSYNQPISVYQKRSKSSGLGECGQLGRNIRKDRSRVRELRNVPTSGVTNEEANIVTSETVTASKGLITNTLLDNDIIYFEQNDNLGAKMYHKINKTKGGKMVRRNKTTIVDKMNRSNSSVHGVQGVLECSEAIVVDEVMDSQQLCMDSNDESKSVAAGLTVCDPGTETSLGTDVTLANAVNEPPSDCMATDTESKLNQLILVQGGEDADPNLRTNAIIIDNRVDLQAAGMSCGTETNLEQTKGISLDKGIKSKVVNEIISIDGIIQSRELRVGSSTESKLNQITLIEPNENVKLDKMTEVNEVPLHLEQVQAEKYACIRCLNSDNEHFLRKSPFVNYRQTSEAYLNNSSKMSKSEIPLSPIHDISCLENKRSENEFTATLLNLHGHNFQGKKTTSAHEKTNHSNENNESIVAASSNAGRMSSRESLVDFIKEQWRSCKTPVEDPNIYEKQANLLNVSSHFSSNDVSQRTSPAFCRNRKPLFCDVEGKTQKKNNTVQEEQSFETMCSERRENYLKICRALENSYKSSCHEYSNNISSISTKNPQAKERDFANSQRERKMSASTLLSAKKILYETPIKTEMLSTKSAPSTVSFWRFLQPDYKTRHSFLEHNRQSLNAQPDYKTRHSFIEHNRQSLNAQKDYKAMHSFKEYNRQSLNADIKQTISPRTCNVTVNKLSEEKIFPEVTPDLQDYGTVSVPQDQASQPPSSLCAVTTNQNVLSNRAESESSSLNKSNVERKWLMNNIKTLHSLPTNKPCEDFCILTALDKLLERYFSSIEELQERLENCNIRASKYDKRRKSKQKRDNKLSHTKSKRQKKQMLSESQTKSKRQKKQMLSESALNLYQSLSYERFNSQVMVEDAYLKQLIHPELVKPLAWNCSVNNKQDSLSDSIPSDVDLIEPTPKSYMNNTRHGNTEPVSGKEPQLGDAIYQDANVSEPKLLNKDGLAAPDDKISESPFADDVALPVEKAPTSTRSYGKSKNQQGEQMKPPKLQGFETNKTCLDSGALPRFTSRLSITPEYPEVHQADCTSSRYKKRAPVSDRASTNYSTRDVGTTVLENQLLGMQRNVYSPTYDKDSNNRQTFLNDSSIRRRRTTEKQVRYNLTTREQEYITQPINSYRHLSSDYVDSEWTNVSSKIPEFRSNGKSDMITKQARKYYSANTEPGAYYIGGVTPREHQERREFAEKAKYVPTFNSQTRIPDYCLNQTRGLSRATDRPTTPPRRAAKLNVCQKLEQRNKKQDYLRSWLNLYQNFSYVDSQVVCGEYLKQRKHRKFVKPLAWNCSVNNKQDSLSDSIPSDVDLIEPTPKNYMNKKRHGNTEPVSGKEPQLDDAIYQDANVSEPKLLNEDGLAAPDDKISESPFADDVASPEEKAPTSTRSYGKSKSQQGEQMKPPKLQGFETDRTSLDSGALSRFISPISITPEYPEVHQADCTSSRYKKRAPVSDRASTNYSTRDVGTTVLENQLLGMQRNVYSPTYDKDSNNRQTFLNDSSIRRRRTTEKQVRYNLTTRKQEYITQPINSYRHLSSDYVDSEWTNVSSKIPEFRSNGKSDMITEQARKYYSTNTEPEAYYIGGVTPREHQERREFAEKAKYVPTFNSQTRIPDYCLNQTRGLSRATNRPTTHPRRAAKLNVCQKLEQRNKKQDYLRSWLNLYQNFNYVDSRVMFGEYLKQLKHREFVKPLAWNCSVNNKQDSLSDSIPSDVDLIEPTPKSYMNNKRHGNTQPVSGKEPQLDDAIYQDANVSEPKLLNEDGLASPDDKISESPLANDVASSDEKASTSKRSYGKSNKPQREQMKPPKLQGFETDRTSLDSGALPRFTSRLSIRPEYPEVHQADSTSSRYKKRAPVSDRASTNYSTRDVGTTVLENQLLGMQRKEYSPTYDKDSNNRQTFLNDSSIRRRRTTEKQEHYNLTTREQEYITQPINSYRHLSSNYVDSEWTNVSSKIPEFRSNGKSDMITEQARKYYSTNTEPEAYYIGGVTPREHQERREFAEKAKYVPTFNSQTRIPDYCLNQTRGLSRATDRPTTPPRRVAKRNVCQKLEQRNKNQDDPCQLSPAQNWFRDLCERVNTKSAINGAVTPQPRQTHADNKCDGNLRIEARICVTPTVCCTPDDAKRNIHNTLGARDVHTSRSKEYCSNFRSLKVDNREPSKNYNDIALLENPAKNDSNIRGRPEGFRDYIYSQVMPVEATVQNKDPFFSHAALEKLQPVQQTEQYKLNTGTQCEISQLTASRVENPRQETTRSNVNSIKECVHVCIQTCACLSKPNGTCLCGYISLNEITSPNKANEYLGPNPERKTEEKLNCKSVFIQTYDDVQRENGKENLAFKKGKRIAKVKRFRLCSPGQIKCRNKKCQIGRSVQYKNESTGVGASLSNNLPCNTVSTHCHRYDREQNTLTEKTTCVQSSSFLETRNNKRPFREEKNICCECKQKFDKVMTLQLETPDLSSEVATDSYENDNDKGCNFPEYIMPKLEHAAGQENSQPYIKYQTKPPYMQNCACKNGQEINVEDRLVSEDDSDVEWVFEETKERQPPSRYGPSQVERLRHQPPDSGNACTISHELTEQISGIIRNSRLLQQQAVLLRDKCKYLEGQGWTSVNQNRHEALNARRSRKSSNMLRCHDFKTNSDELVNTNNNANTEFDHKLDQENKIKCFNKLTSYVCFMSNQCTPYKNDYVTDTAVSYYPKCIRQYRGHKGKFQRKEYFQHKQEFQHKNRNWNAKPRKSPKDASSDRSSQKRLYKHPENERWFINDPSEEAYQYMRAYFPDICRNAPMKKNSTFSTDSQVPCHSCKDDSRNKECTEQKQLCEQRSDTRQASNVTIATSENCVCLKEQNLCETKFNGSLNLSMQVSKHAEGRTESHITVKSGEETAEVSHNRETVHDMVQAPCLHQDIYYACSDVSSACHNVFGQSVSLGNDSAHVAPVNSPSALKKNYWQLAYKIGSISGNRHPDSHAWNRQLGQLNRQRQEKTSGEDGERLARPAPPAVTKDRTRLQPLTEAHCETHSVATMVSSTNLKKSFQEHIPLLDDKKLTSYFTMVDSGSSCYHDKYDASVSYLAIPQTISQTYSNIPLYVGCSSCPVIRDSQAGSVKVMKKSHNLCQNCGDISDICDLSKHQQDILKFGEKAGQSPEASSSCASLIRVKIVPNEESGVNVLKEIFLDVISADIADTQRNKSSGEAEQHVFTSDRLHQASDASHQQCGHQLQRQEKSEQSVPQNITNFECVSSSMANYVSMQKGQCLPKSRMKCPCKLKHHTNVLDSQDSNHGIEDIPLNITFSEHETTGSDAMKLKEHKPLNVLLRKNSKIGKKETVLIKRPLSLIKQDKRCSYLNNFRMKLTSPKCEGIILPEWKSVIDLENDFQPTHETAELHSPSNFHRHQVKAETPRQVTQGRVVKLSEVSVPFSDIESRLDVEEESSKEQVVRWWNSPKCFQKRRIRKDIAKYTTHAFRSRLPTFLDKRGPSIISKSFGDISDSSSIRRSRCIDVHERDSLAIASNLEYPRDNKSLQEMPIKGKDTLRNNTRSKHFSASKTSDEVTSNKWCTCFLGCAEVLEANDQMVSIEGSYIRQLSPLREHYDFKTCKVHPKKVERDRSQCMDTDSKVVQFRLVLSRNKGSGDSAEISGKYSRQLLTSGGYFNWELIF